MFTFDANANAMLAALYPDALDVEMKRWEFDNQGQWPSAFHKEDNSEKDYENDNRYYG